MHEGNQYRVRQYSMNIAIVGYGTAGQAAAILLSRDGHRVEVFERARELGPVGAGFLLQPTGLQVLWELGVLDQALAHGRVVRRLYGETPGGRAVMDMRYAGLGADMFGLGMQRGALFGLLAQAWADVEQVHRGTRIIGIDDTSAVGFDEEVPSARALFAQDANQAAALVQLLEESRRTNLADHAVPRAVNVQTVSPVLSRSTNR